MSRFLKANISQYGHVTDVATLRCHAHVHIDIYVKLKRAGNWMTRAFGFDKTYTSNYLNNMCAVTLH